MCLIAASATGRVKPEYIRNGFANHPDGCGIAWHEKDGIHYKKGLEVEEAIKLAAELPVGYVMHMRWASVGGKDKSLIHPFPIMKDVPLKDEGVAKSVLFHNGHWNQWNNVLVNHLSSRITLPRGKWSDTRAIAFLVSVHGRGILKLIETAGKFVVMEGGKNYGFGYFETEDGVSYSNSSYKSYVRGGCGTGLASVGTSYTPVGTRPIPQPSQPLLPNSTTSDEAEALTPEEFDELKAYFEKDLAEPGIIQGA